MKTLKDIPVGTTVTVRRVKLERGRVDELENRGMAAGTDLTVLEVLPDGGIRAQYSRGELLFTPAEAVGIGVGDHFAWKNDPLLMGGCCAGGLSGDIQDKIEKIYERAE